MPRVRSIFSVIQQCLEERRLDPLKIAFRLAQNVAGDELGLFEGPPVYEEADPSDLPRIRLFLANIWEWADRDEQDFRDEVGTTFLHELGHYLGWDEDEVARRGLD